MRYSTVAVIRGLTVPCAILIGSAIIGGAIAGAPIIAPYRIAAINSSDLVWRLNTVTGEGRLCVRTQDIATRLYNMNCEYQGH